jgi:hypothetical protein
MYNRKIIYVSKSLLFHVIHNISHHLFVNPNKQDAVAHYFFSIKLEPRKFVEGYPLLKKQVFSSYVDE